MWLAHASGNFILSKTRVMVKFREESEKNQKYMMAIYALH